LCWLLTVILLTEIDFCAGDNEEQQWLAEDDTTDCNVVSIDELISGFYVIFTRTTLASAVLAIERWLSVCLSV